MAVDATILAQQYRRSAPRVLEGTLIYCTFPTLSPEQILLRRLLLASRIKIEVLLLYLIRKSYYFVFDVIFTDIKS